MRRHPSVASVTQARVLRPATTDSYKFLGLPSSLWAAAGGPSSAGDGTVIGIVDTGIWPEHASFDDTGYSSTLPSGWSGTCPTTSDFACNNKIIGGGVFHAGFESVGTTIDLSGDWMSPRDSAGHGTWCAGAAAGNNNVPIPNMGTASGMAPRARLAMYKIFWKSNGNMYATSPDIFSAVDQAVADGVDVLSLSLGGASPTDTYFDDVPFISVHAAGVFVAFAAGNDGRPSAFAATGYRTLCNFSPYYMTVGASSISRNGASISSTTATATATSLEAPPNTTTPTALATSTTVSTLSGARIPASISPAATAAPVVAYFSSTGPLAKPSAATPAAYPSNTILKPDLIAPGVELYAAFPGRTVGSKGGFQALSGTSMATPHIAGIAALIIQQHPDWTPSQIMSAMMTTARTTNTGNGAIKNEYGAAASPWEMGAGHVVPARVVDPGLTYDAGEQDFRNFLAGQNYNRAKGEFGTASLRAVSAKNLNRPAISLAKVHNKASVTRTVTNVADTTSTYRSFKFGSLTWVDGKGHSVRSVLAVQPSSACCFPPDVSSLYIVRLRSAPPVASYRGGFPGFPATAVWDSDPNGSATDAAASDAAANGSVAVGTASVSSSSSSAAAGAATTSGLGWLGRRPRRARVNVRAPGVRAFKQLLQRMQQAVLRDSGVDAGKMLYSASKVVSYPAIPCDRLPCDPHPLRLFRSLVFSLTPSRVPFFSYKHASNGFSATLTAAQVRRMRRHPSVASVTQARVLRPATTDSYKFLGLPSSLWAAAGGPSSAGDGTVIGIVDTGIWPEHGSFDDTVGYYVAMPRLDTGIWPEHGSFDDMHPTDPPLPILPSAAPPPSTNPPPHQGYSSTLPAGWSGTCPTTSDFACNKKIIGGGVFHKAFESGNTTIDLTSDWHSARDSSGHGTWCAGAAAGNSVPISNMGTANGMAPGARLAMYKVFWQANGYVYATSPDIFSAVDQAVADGVDVLSLSLGGASPTDTYFDDVPFISVHAAGVFVAFAAGNDGRPNSAAATGYRTLCNFSPYYMTVGASTISRDGASISPTTAAAGKTTAAATAAISPLETPSNTTATTVSTLTGVRIPASISPAATTAAAPVIAYFSATGPLAKPSAAVTPSAYPSNIILKPDIIAPGVEIFSAAPDHTVGSGGWFVALSGTSMATPHIAGIAALIIQRRPDWTPSQIMSAMMTTARTTNTNNGAIQNEYGSAASPWEMGAGHVVPARVVDPGLTYDAGEQDFRNFLAGQNYNWAKGEFGTASLKAVAARNLNRPSISLPQIETLHVPEDSSSASGAEPHEAASSQTNEALRDEADGSETQRSSEGHGQQAAAAFGARHGDAEGDDLAEDFDYLDLEDLEQTWPERRESILGTRCGSPKGATEVGIMRSDAIRFGGPRESLKSWTPQPRA
ncbi:unnamed protein product [Closterium sp. Yama58-4]|nr:unnamed protein product [Closterium sp. Yama58-4]